MRMAKPKAIEKKFRLEEHLVLAPFIANLLGIQNLSEITSFNDVSEEPETTGRSSVYHRLVSRGGLQITHDALCQYDDNIRGYVKRMSKSRGETIHLKYFQHLALLFMEIYLDMYFNNRIGLLNQLLEYQQKNKLMTEYPYTKNDLKKLAFWMATGSGKTLLMHINMWQIQRYNNGPNAIPFENIILITPNESLSEQHIEEMKKSGIGAIKFRGDNGGYFSVDESKVVKVIEITKLKLHGEKKGEGESIDIDSFEDRNLVLVDEGHKGQQSEEKKWMAIREALAKNGLTFEYSATFGQVIKNEKSGGTSKELITYSKAILFDYSYKYFHADGYGKEFRLLNLKDDYDNHTETILLANTVSFYEQLRVYEDLEKRAKEYNIEQPLWVFLGHKVQEDESDILAVLRFLNKLIENRNDWVLKKIKSLLEGRSGLVTDGKDAFAKRTPETVFPYLREKAIPAEEVMEGIFQKVFGLNPGDGRKLYLSDIKKAEGELGLKASASRDYFGVINIGDKTKFKNFVEKEESGIVVENDSMSESLFNSIEQRGTKLNVLIGAKKFIEGWNCWRVSTMGLMNVGKGEGPQIIQLFGRGVRLKGKEFSLKRSQAIKEIEHPKFIDVLETLGIFGIKANYLTSFKEMLELEEVKTYEVLRVPIEIKRELLEGLKILRLKNDAIFKNDCLFALSDVSGVTANLNILPKIDLADSRKGESIVNTTKEPSPQLIEEKYLDLLDWSRIYLDMLSYRANKKWFNMSFKLDDLKGTIYGGKYSLYAPDEIIKPNEFKKLERLEEVVIRLLSNYIEKCYNRRRNEWEKNNYELVEVSQDDANFPSEYLVKVEESAALLIGEVRERIQSKIVYSDKSKDDPLPNVFYEKHLYQPLLSKTQTDKVVFHHTGLTESERRFVTDLAKHVAGLSEEGAQYYLLRNLTRGKGVGFCETHAFYPDFILWIKRNDFQWVVFVEPHGMIFSSGLEDEKVQLYKHLGSNITPLFTDSQIKFDSFIISATDFNQFTKRFFVTSPTMEQLAKEHILFMDKSERLPNPYYIEELINITINNNS